MKFFKTKSLPTKMDVVLAETKWQFVIFVLLFLQLIAISWILVQPAATHVELFKVCCERGEAAHQRLGFPE